VRNITEQVGTERQNGLANVRWVTARRAVSTLRSPTHKPPHFVGSNLPSLTKTCEACHRLQKGRETC
jgi:hypothetical protein